jgi:hypothetical protein
MIRSFRRSPLVALLGVLIAFEVLATESITTNSIMIDEFAHLPAGVAYLRHGLYSMYDENPPLARDLIALPAVLFGAKMDYSRAGGSRRWEWDVAQDFRKTNPDRYLAMFAWGRFVIVGLSVACGALIFLWAHRLYGAAAAAFCATLWFSDPNVLAHSTIATTDVAATFFGLLATFLFSEHLRNPSLRSTVSTGLALGLAVGTKFTLVVLVPAWAVMALVTEGTRLPSHARAPWRAVVQAATASLAALLVLNALYGFRGTFSALGSFTFTSPLLSGSPQTPVGDLVGNRFQGTWWGGVPMPLPSDLLIGLDSQLNEQQTGKFANLVNGRIVDGGSWFSPLRILCLKTPEGSLLLFALTAFSWLRNRRAGTGELLPLIPPLILLGFLCSQAGGLNFAYRYTLPALPFLFIATGRFVRAAWTHTPGRIFLVICLASNAAAVLSSRPSYLSYGNGLVGGIDGAQRMFLGSNYDWGQDLFRLKHWSDDHPKMKPLVVAFYGPMVPSEVGLETRLPPATLFRHPHDMPAGVDGPFYLAISSNGMHGLPSYIDGGPGITVAGIFRSTWLRPENAIARVGSTIFIFRVSPGTGATGAGTLTVEQLAGSIDEIRPTDIIGTP